MIPNSDAVYARLRRILCEDLYPDAEIRRKTDLVMEIERLKRDRNAVVLGHNYMEPALFHTVPDFVGDSLELSRRAAAAEADVIVFCGVRFMAETAKVLNPSRTVLIPSPEAGCSLAASITAENVRELRRRYPGAPVVTYINTYADVKAETDICCTSGNAAKVVESLDAETIIFLPDEYLARNIARDTGRRIVIANGKEAGDDAPGIVGWTGRCEVHEKFTVEDIENVKRRFPGTIVLAHPECSPEVVEAADFAGSTSAMIRYVENTPAPRYLLLTECSMGDNILAAHPEKEMIRMCSHRCPHMAEITLEATLDALAHNQFEVTVAEEIRVRALGSIERMLAIA